MNYKIQGKHINTYTVWGKDEKRRGRGEWKERSLSIKRRKRRNRKQREGGEKEWFARDKEE